MSLLWSEIKSYILNTQTCITLLAVSCDRVMVWGADMMLYLCERSLDFSVLKLQNFLNSSANTFVDKYCVLVYSLYDSCINFYWFFLWQILIPFTYNQQICLYNSIPPTPCRFVCPLLRHLRIKVSHVFRTVLRINESSGIMQG